MQNEFKNVRPPLESWEDCCQLGRIVERVWGAGITSLNSPRTARRPSGLNSPDEVQRTGNDFGGTLTGQSGLWSPGTYD